LATKLATNIQINFCRRRPLLIEINSPQARVAGLAKRAILPAQAEDQTACNADYMNASSADAIIG
jgi:hypothetical protein